VDLVRLNTLPMMKNRFDKVYVPVNRIVVEGSVLLILQILNWWAPDLPRLMHRNLIRKLMHMQIALSHGKPKLMN
jgi:hypothetical protein